MISSPSRSAAEGFLAKRARLKRIARRFDCPALTRAYIVGKLATDPAYAAVFERYGAAPQPIVDIGCGMGLLAHFLRERGCTMPIRGFDFDARKVAIAQSAAERGALADTGFAVGDAAEQPLEAANLVLLDVLQYLEPGARGALLESLAARAREGCGVLIRSAVRDRTWRYRLTMMQEAWSRWSGWIPGRSPVTFPTLKEITAPFEAAGCRCDVRPLWGRTPFNSHLVVAGHSE